MPGLPGIPPTVSPTPGNSGPGRESRNAPLRAATSEAEQTLNAPANRHRAKKPRRRPSKKRDPEPDPPRLGKISEHAFGCPQREASSGPHECGTGRLHLLGVRGSQPRLQGLPPCGLVVLLPNRGERTAHGDVRPPTSSLRSTILEGERPREPNKATGPYPGFAGKTLLRTAAESRQGPTGDGLVPQSCQSRRPPVDFLALCRYSVGLLSNGDKAGRGAGRGRAARARGRHRRSRRHDGPHPCSSNSSSSHRNTT